MKSKANAKMKCTEFHLAVTNYLLGLEHFIEVKMSKRRQNKSLWLKRKKEERQNREIEPSKTPNHPDLALIEGGGLTFANGGFPVSMTFKNLK